MVLWLSLMGLHLAGLVGYTLLLRRRAVGATDKLVVAALMQTGIFVPVFIVMALGSPVRFGFGLWQWISLVASGFFLAGVHVTAVKALEQLEASVFTLVYTLRLFLTTLLGFLFLQELPTGLQLLGGLVIALSIFALHVGRGRLSLRTPLLFGLLATVWFSVHATIEKFNVTQVGFTNYMFWSGLIAVAILWALAFKNGSTVGSIRAALDRKMAWLVLLRIFSGWGYVLALGFGSLAVTNYVSGLSVVLVVLCGIILLGERENIRQKLIVASLAAVGLSLILLGKL